MSNAAEYATDAEKQAHHEGQRAARRDMTAHLETAAKARQKKRDEDENEYLSWLGDAE